MLAAPAAAQAANTDVKVANFAFSPTSVTVLAGDSVTWHFDGPDTNHSVTTNAGQADNFDSDPGNSSPLHVPGSTFAHTFNATGTFTYFCKVHPFMTGKVDVKPLGSDITAPVVSGLKVKPGSSTKITFKLSEAAKVTFSFKRSGGGSPKPVKLSGRQGTNTLKRKLRSGSYTLSVVAADAAGNKSKAAKARFKVK
jgi:plastocyanin